VSADGEHPKAARGFSTRAIVLLVVALLFGITVVAMGVQSFVEMHEPIDIKHPLDHTKTEYEIAKLTAEISHLRSDTKGSLYWLKLVALFVTVGGVVGGYLVAQSRSTVERLSFERKRTTEQLDFDKRKNVDEVYQSIVRELADDEPVLRAAAAVKLGAILKSFPVEWSVSEARRGQMVQLTKQVLASAMSIEKEPKVLKMLSINVALHKRGELSDMIGLDLSGADAHDAYWARCDLSGADCFKATISAASFRKSKLDDTQLREVLAEGAVFDEVDGKRTVFKMANLRWASFKKATLTTPNFDGAKVHGACLDGARFIAPMECQVDIAAPDENARLVSVHEWLGAHVSSVTG